MFAIGVVKWQWRMADAMVIISLNVLVLNFPNESQTSPLAKYTASKSNTTNIE